MIALSVRQPDAWLLVHGVKEVENRSRSTRTRGAVAIHASQTRMTASDWDYLREICAALRIPSPSEAPGGIEYGGIVGAVEILDCVTRSDSPWFDGPHGYVIGGALPCAFVPCKGALGFWNAPGDIDDLIPLGD